MNKFLLVALVLLLTASLSFGAGFGLYEFGARASALGGATVAQGYDASTAFYNPAGLVYLKGTQFYGGVTLISSSSKWVGPAPIYPNKVYEAEKQLHNPIGVYLTHSFSDKFAMGVSVTNPFGLGLKWSDDFPGRFVAKDTDLKSFYISPVIAFSPLPGFSIGGGADLVYSTVTLERHVLYPEDSHPGTEVGSVRLEGNSKLALGFSASMMYKVQNFSLGFLYRHKVKNQFENGDAKVSLNDDYYKTFLQQGAHLVDQKVSTEITYPSFISVGAHYQITPKLGAEIDYMWYKWDVFDVLTLDFDQTEDVTVLEKYKNSSQIRFGIHYAVSDQLELRGGYIYDQTPQPAQSMSPLLPDADRNDFSVGVGYKMGSMQFDLAYMLVDFGKRSTIKNGEGTNWDGFEGSYTSVANLFMFSFGFAF